MIIKCLIVERSVCDSSSSSGNGRREYNGNEQRCFGCIFFIRDSSHSLCTPLIISFSNIFIRRSSNSTSIYPTYSISLYLSHVSLFMCRSAARITTKQHQPKIDCTHTHTHISIWVTGTIYFTLFILTKVIWNLNVPSAYLHAFLNLCIWIVRQCVLVSARILLMRRVRFYTSREYPTFKFSSLFLSFTRIQSIILCYCSVFIFPFVLISIRFKSAQPLTYPFAHHTWCTAAAAKAYSKFFSFCSWIKY